MRGSWPSALTLSALPLSALRVPALQGSESSGGRQLLAHGPRGPELIAAGHEGTVRKLLERAGRRKQESLPGDAPQRQKRRDLRLELDPFGHGIEPQRLPQRDDRTRQVRSVAGAGQAMDERAIDFQDVDGEAMQVRKG